MYLSPQVLPPLFVANRSCYGGYMVYQMNHFYHLLIMMSLLTAPASGFAAAADAKEEQEIHSTYYTEAKSNLRESLKNRLSGEKVKSIAIDIKPGDSANMIDAKSERTLKVALYGSADFAVSHIEQKSLTLDNVSPKQNFVMFDINNDGFVDLVTEFPVADLDFIDGVTYLWIKGKTKDNHHFEGFDVVTVTNGA